MKIAALVALVLAAVLAAPARAEECTFNQSGVASELQRMARRHPGYRAIAGASAVEWAQPNGYTVRLGYGGCEDLGAEVRVERAGAKRSPGTRELIAAVSRYWSPGQARALKAAFASGKLVRRVEDGTALLEGPGSLSPAFPLGFTIVLGTDQVSLSWPIA